MLYCKEFRAAVHEENPSRSAGRVRRSALLHRAGPRAGQALEGARRGRESEVSGGESPAEGGLRPRDAGVEGAAVGAALLLRISPEELTRAAQKREKRQEKLSAEPGFSVFCKDCKSSVTESEGTFGAALLSRTDGEGADEEAARAVEGAARVGEGGVEREAGEGEAGEGEAEPVGVPAVHVGPLRGAAAGEPG